jgi:hypothetical protein
MGKRTERLAFTFGVVTVALVTLIIGMSIPANLAAPRRLPAYALWAVRMILWTVSRIERIVNFFVDATHDYGASHGAYPRKSCLSRAC